MSFVQLVASEVKPCKKCGAMERYASNGDCAPCQRARALARKAAKGDEIRAKERQRWAEKREEINSRRRDRYSANPMPRKIKNREWRSANPDKCRAGRDPIRQRAHDQNRRALKKRLGGRLSPNIVQMLLVLQRGKCAACRQPLRGDYHLDHIMPLALGGEHTDANMQLLHSKCNLRKNAKHPVDFMRERGFLI